MRLIESWQAAVSLSIKFFSSAHFPPLSNIDIHYYAHHRPQEFSFDSTIAAFGAMLCFLAYTRK
jgi:hypothetical protein